MNSTKRTSWGTVGLRNIVLSSGTALSDIELSGTGKEEAMVEPIRTPLLEALWMLEQMEV